MKTSTKLETLYEKNKNECNQKGIDNPPALGEVILKDKERIAYEIFNIINTSVSSLLVSFFQNDQRMVGQINDLIKNTDKLDHIGLTVMEPMDIVEQGFKYWISFFNQHCMRSINEDYSLRFTASEKFQQRVGADIEIMRIALSDRADDQSLLLELFDIRKKNTDPSFGCDVETKSGFTSPKKSNQPRQYFSAAQKNIAKFKDNIRHYAITALDVNSVKDINQILTNFCNQDDKYQLTSESVISNPKDGSHHIKIVKKNDDSSKNEIEFVAYEDLSTKQ